MCILFTLGLLHYLNPYSYDNMKIIFPHDNRLLQQVQSFVFTLTAAATSEVLAALVPDLIVLVVDLGLGQAPGAVPLSTELIR